MLDHHTALILRRRQPKDSGLSIAINKILDDLRAQVPDITIEAQTLLSEHSEGIVDHAPIFRLPVLSKEDTKSIHTLRGNIAHTKDYLNRTSMVNFPSKRKEHVCKLRMPTLVHLRDCLDHGGAKKNMRSLMNHEQKRNHKCAASH